MCSLADPTCVPLQAGPKAQGHAVLAKTISHGEKMWNDSLVAIIVLDERSFSETLPGVLQAWSTVASTTSTRSARWLMHVLGRLPFLRATPAT